MPNVFIQTYGCSENFGESEIMAGLLTKSGFDIVKNIENADVIILNTCYVKSPTEQKILFRIKDVQEKYPDKKLIIAGCMVEAAYRKVLDIAPEASLISTHYMTDVSRTAKKTLEGKKVELIGKKKEVKLCLPKIRKNPIIDIVPISSGCTGYCTYCSVKLAKGDLFSYPEDKILKEIEIATKQGCKEIWLTAQDTAAYGMDDDKGLPELLKSISKIPGNFSVRVGMMNPKNVKDILPDLISAYRNKKIYRFLHLPVQSGDNEILRSMNRGYKVEDFENIVKAFEENFKFQLWTDVIVGYSDETQEQFEKTIKLIEKIRPDWVNISKFGIRPGTEAAKLKPLSSHIIKKRSKIASELVRKISLEKNKEWIGWEGKILITERGKIPGQWIGRNFAYKPVIVNEKNILLGDILKIKVINALSSGLLGQPLYAGN